MLMDKEGKRMKKMMCIVLSLVLLGIAPMVSAEIPVFNHLTPIVNQALPPYAATACKHEMHIRTTENTIRYVYENETVHLVQEVFPAVCAECGKDMQTIFDSQVAQSHNWVLAYEYCDKATGMHDYFYRCACKELSFSIRCTENHVLTAQAIETPAKSE